MGAAYGSRTKSPRKNPLGQNPPGKIPLDKIPRTKSPGQNPPYILYTLSPCHPNSKHFFNESVLRSVGWCTISVVCVLIHPAYDLVVQYMNFGFACVGCPSLITLPTNCSIAQYLSTLYKCYFRRSAFFHLCRT